MMTKRIFLTILLAVFVLMGRAQLMTEATNPQGQLQVEVSEEVELMSILSRAAGRPEFSFDLAAQYSKDVESWLSEYRKHPTVAYYQDIIAKYGIGYERVTNMAIHIEIAKGKVNLIGNRSELNNGWENVNLDDFIKHLNKFYEDTRFHEFFEQHKSFYQDFLKTYQASVVPHIHPEWYSQFFNGTEPTDRFHAIIGFNYGDTNNGSWRQLPDQPREVFAVLGYQIVPMNGRPLYDVSLPVHEYAHSFVNPLLDKSENAALMESVGPKLLHLSEAVMQRQAYPTWQIVINESIVRAAVILYFSDQGFGQKVVQGLMQREVMQNGFRWMPELVASLQNYATHRDQYPPLNDYYPEIARCLTEYVAKEAEKQ